jgi:hypothetical protein
VDTDTTGVQHITADLGESNLKSETSISIRYYEFLNIKRDNLPKVGLNFFLPMSFGGRAEGLVCADPRVRTPVPPLVGAEISFLKHK